MLGAVRSGDIAAAVSAALLIALSLGALPAGARSAKPHKPATVYVSINAGGKILRVKPKSIHLISNENLNSLSWQSWGGRSAKASGQDSANGPSPGHKRINPVQVTATDRRRCGKRLVYTTIRIHFTRGVPYANQSHHTRYHYGCPR